MNRARSEFWDWVRSIIIAVILAFLVRIFLVEIFLVDGSSMYPTLKDSERLIVNKITYRFNEPQNGDIVVFKFSSQRDFIKRVMATEGDTLQIVGGKVYVNEQLIDEPYIYESFDTDFGPVVVPDDHLFVMGDNRINSMDSRDPAVGFISLERVKGKAFFVFWPLSEVRVIS